MRTCIIALGTGRRLGLDDAALSDAYYATLRRSIGCTAYASEEASLFGDDIQYRNTYFPVGFGKPEEVVAATRSHLASTAALDVRRRAVSTFLGDGPKIAGAMADAACPVAVRLATRLGMGEKVCRALRSKVEMPARRERRLRTCGGDRRHGASARRRRDLGGFQ